MPQLELVTTPSPTGLLDTVARVIAGDPDGGWAIVVPRTHLAREVTRALLRHTGTDAWVGNRVLTVDDVVAHYAKRLEGKPALTTLQVRQIIASVVLDLHEDSGGEIFPGQVIDGRVSEATLRSLTRLFAELEPFRWSFYDLQERLEEGPQSASTQDRAWQVGQVYKEYLDRIFNSEYQGPQGQAVAAAEMARHTPPPDGVSKFFFLGLDTSGLKDVGVRTAYALAKNPEIEDVRWALILPETLDKDTTAWEKHGNTHLFEAWSDDFHQRTHLDAEERLEHLPEDLAAIALDPFAYRLDPARATGAVRAVRVPDTQIEVEWVSQDIKHRILDDGTPPEQIAVVARDMDRRASDLEKALGELGVPVVSSREERSGNVPAVRALLSLFRLGAYGWRVRDLVAVAESPYLATGLNPTLLARIGNAGTMPTDADDWSRRISAFRRETVLEDAQGERRGGDLPAKHADMATELEAKFEGFRAQLAAAIGEGAKSPAGWVTSLIEAIETWDLQRQVYETSELVDRGRRALLARADLDGLNALARAANDWLAGREISGLDDTPMTARAWFDELSSMAAETKIRASTFPRDAVQLLLPAQASLREWDVVYIIGLVDGTFPLHSEPTDHTLSDEERRALHLPTAEQRNARERLLFQLAAATARTQLMLVAPAADARGKALVTSPFVTCLPLRVEGLEIESVTARQMVAEKTEDVLWEADVHVLAAERYREALETAKDEDRDIGEVIAADPLLRRWLATDAGMKATRSWAVERMRDGLDRRLALAGASPVALPLGEFAALFDPADLPDGVVDEAAAFSPSEISAYERCHFRVYASRLLGLSRTPEHEDDHDEAAAFGTLQHRILEKLYGELMTDGAMPPTKPSHLNDALERLERIAAAEVRTFMASAHDRLWSLDLDFVLDVLRDFVRRDLSRMLHAQQEAEAPEIRTRIVNLEERVGPIPADVDGVRFQLRGKIDRVEAIDDVRVDDAAQGWLILRDYKSTRNQNFQRRVKHYLEGRSIQLPLYAHMAEEHYGTGVFGFGELRTSQSEDPPALMVRGAVPDGVGGLDLLPVQGSNGNPVKTAKEAALEIAAEQVKRMRAGQFAPQPGRQCFGCRFKDVCRSALIADPARMRNRAQMPLAVSPEAFEEAKRKLAEIQGSEAASGSVSP